MKTANVGALAFRMPKVGIGAVDSSHNDQPPNTSPARIAIPMEKGCVEGKQSSEPSVQFSGAQRERSGVGA